MRHPGDNDHITGEIEVDPDATDDDTGIENFKEGLNYGRLPCRDVQNCV